MEVMEFGIRGGMTGKGLQWDIIEVKGGLESVRVAEDLLDVEEERDEGGKEAAEFSNFT